MEDFKVVLKRSEEELASLNQRKAVIASKVSALVEELGLDKEQPLEPQIEALKKELDQKIADSNDKVQKLLEQLKELGDE